MPLLDDFDAPLRPNSPAALARDLAEISALEATRRLKSHDLDDGARPRKLRIAPPAPRENNFMWRFAAAFAAAATLGMGAVAARIPIVAGAPGTAGVFAAVGLPVNLKGVAIEDVKAETTDVGDRRTLLVVGALRNLKSEPVALDDLRVAVLGADRDERYSWTSAAPKARLEKGETARFRVLLAAPPDGAQAVLVKFAPPADKKAMARGG